MAELSTDSRRSARLRAPVADEMPAGSAASGRRAPPSSVPTADGAGALWQAARQRAEGIAQRSGLSPEHPSWSVIIAAFAAGYVAGQQDANGAGFGDTADT